MGKMQIDSRELSSRRAVSQIHNSFSRIDFASLYGDWEDKGRHPDSWKRRHF